MDESDREFFRRKRNADRKRFIRRVKADRAAAVKEAEGIIVSGQVPWLIIGDCAFTANRVDSDGVTRFYFLVCQTHKWSSKPLPHMGTFHDLAHEHERAVAAAPAINFVEDLLGFDNDWKERQLG